MKNRAAGVFHGSFKRIIKKLLIDYLRNELRLFQLFVFCLQVPHPRQEVDRSVNTDHNLNACSLGLFSEIFIVALLQQGQYL